MTRASLRNPAFLSLPMSEQRELYLSVLDQNMNALGRKHGLAKSMADEGPGAGMGFKGYDPGFEGSTKAFKELVDSVDFPQFVADLLNGVFDANINVMQKQTEAYIKLMQDATKSVGDYLKKIEDEDTFSYLVENKPDQFNMSMETDENGNQKMALTNPQGEKVDMEDNEVKAKIMEAKIAMAQEQRAILREILLMGVTRLVVEKGVVEAAVEYKITATRNSKVDTKRQNTNIFSASGSFWGIKAGMTNTNISINTTKKEAKDDLSAKLMGKVNIQFKTDYFKLDNFANMYASGGAAALKQGTASGAPAAIPAPTPAPVALQPAK